MEKARGLLKGASLAADVFQAVKNADVAVFVTEWNEFRDIDLVKIKQLMRTPVIVDCRNIYEPSRMEDLGFRYYSVGRLSKGDG